MAEVTIAEAYMVRIVVEADPSDAADAIVFPVDAEAMQVGVSPAHGEVQRVMEISDRVVAAHHESTPDQGRDLAQPHVKLIGSLVDACSTVAYPAYHDALPYAASWNTRGPHFVMVSSPTSPQFPRLAYQPALLVLRHRREGSVCQAVGQ